MTPSNRNQIRWLAGAVIGWPAGQALAHGPAGHGAHDHRWTHWTSDPLIIISLVVITAAYAWGVRGVWREAGIGRGVTRAQVGLFAVAIGVMVLALLSPIDAMSDQLNAAHMVQHMLLMMVAAPLMVMALPMVVGLRALPRRLRHRLGRWRGQVQRTVGPSPWYLLWQPLLMWGLFACVLWVWHLPKFYEAALHHERIHDLQHVMLFVAACLFWRVLLDPVNRLRMGMGVGVLYLFTTSLHAALLGVFMALAPGVWYETYEGRTEVWGLAAIEDQQLAGLIMWMPGCAVYAIIAALLAWVWLTRDERMASRSAALGRQVT